MQEEVWRTTERLKGFYEVSNLGGVRRVAPGRGATVGRVLKTPLNAHGYQHASIFLWQNKVCISIEIHRLICEAFHGSPGPGHEVNHINCDKTDNRAENLEWVTKSENMIHAHKMGRIVTDVVGSKNPSSKLGERDVVTIRKELEKGTFQRELAVKYSVDQTTISNIKVRKTWPHVA